MVKGDRSEGPVRPTAGGGVSLRTAVTRLERELAGYRRFLPDRAVAEEELAELERQACAGTAAPEQLRQSLLLVAAALGSVSGLAAAVAELREAVEQELNRQPPQPATVRARLPRR
ncbi:DUF5955 family protein [Streptomyces sp. NPDC020983]|uniref:DUF5955 family protein n=1 Tax=Streptomyces sp. NPDC020983 TaxID=3365106 RepID=UPI00379B6C73